MKINKKIVFSFGFVLFSIGLSFGQNVNKLVIDPDVSTGKYYCDFTVDINTENGGASHTNCQYLVKFDTGDVGLSYNSRGSAFSNTDAEYYTGVDSDILAVEERNSAEITSSVTCSVLNLWNKTTNPGFVLLKFVDLWGSDPTSSTFITTNDKLNLSKDGADTLTGVDNIIIPFEMCPCILDGDNPFADTTTLSNSAVNGGQLTGIHDISVLFVDDGGTSWGYWYSGLAINTGNYTSVGLPVGMDNQEGVDSTTLAVNIDYSSNYGVSDDYFDSTELSPLAYTGTISSRPEITWDNNNRGYWISFENTHDYKVERPVIITITGYDNALAGNSPCTRSAQMGITTYTFNAFVVPVMNNFIPANSATFINPSVSSITFEVSDTWAGVDTGKVWVTIAEIISGGQVLMTGYTYSGADLTFSGISGAPGTGNAGGYYVSFVPNWDFPTDTGINLTGVVVDLAGYTGTASWSFETRPSCDFYGCNEILNIYIMTGSYFNSGNPYLFTGELLIVTGTNINSSYPYLTGIDNNILMCGFPYTGTILDANFDIFSVDGITTINPYLYTGSELYITGLDFTYSDGVITVN